MITSEVAISVIVPVYNIEKYIGQCIESILNQTFRDFELILINDGSFDYSYKICQEFAKKDARIRLFSQENKGLSAARNLGITVATGACITFIDGDDYVVTSYLENLYKVYQENDADIVVGDYYQYADKNNALYYHVLKTDYGIYRKSIEEVKNLAVSKVTFITAWGKLFKRDLFKSILFPENRFFEDNFTSMKLYLMAKNIYYLCDSLYCYRIREDSITGSNLSIKKIVDSVACYEESILDLLFNKKDPSFVVDYYQLQLIKFKDYLEDRNLTHENIYFKICNRLKLMKK